MSEVKKEEYYVSPIYGDWIPFVKQYMEDRGLHWEDEEDERWYPLWNESLRICV